MGEYAEMMLDGTCCVQCGEYLGGRSAGFPVMCGSCQQEEHQQRSKRVKCPTCGKTCKSEEGVRAHSFAKHGSQA